MKSNLNVFKVFLIFCIISYGSSVEFDNFYVQSSGHSKVKPGEIAVVFYMTIANSGIISKKIYSKNTKCCWIHPGSSTKYDCQSMDLLGGMPVTLEPSKTANITYLFTNLYPLDRVGQCVFHLWHSKNKIAHTIRFNTTYHFQEADTWLGSLYKTIAGDDTKDKACDTVDLDPRRKCKPVNCVQKYNGKRNFFRKETKLCEPVHECYTSKDNEGLPTTAFDKDHNKCKSLIQKELTKDEERDLKDNVRSHMDASERAKFKNVGPSDPIPVRCNHGKRVGEICVCEDGWRTDTSNVPLGDPKFVYNWCNIRTRKKPLLHYKLQKHFMIAGLSLTSFTLFVTWLWMIHRYIYPQPERERTKFRRPDTNKHVWQKSNLVATGKLLKELADREKLKKLTTPETTASTTTESRELTQDGTSKSKSILKEKSALSSITQSAKNIFSSRSLPSEKSSVTASNNDDKGSMSLVKQQSLAQQPPMTDNEAISNVSICGKTMNQERSYDLPGHATQDISVQAATLSGRPQSVSTSDPNARSSETRNVSYHGDRMVQQRSTSLPVQISQETPDVSGNTMFQQRCYSQPDQTLQEVSSQDPGISLSGGSQVSRISKDELTQTRHVSSDEGVVKEPSRIVASRTTRAGSTYTLAGPLLMQKRLSTSVPVAENFSDSD